MITGKYGWSSSSARIRARISALLLETIFISYAAGSGCDQARRGIGGL